MKENDYSMGLTADGYRFSFRSDINILKLLHRWLHNPVNMLKTALNCALYMGELYRK